MSDILFELPWYCDDCETWHREFIWCHADGSYTSCDECGDHEPIEEADLPSQDEYDRIWREYTQWVLDTGTDPLGNFNVQHVRRVTERWQLWIFKTLTGPRLDRAKRAGRIYQPQELPEYVKSFLNLQSDNRLGDFRFWEELIECEPGIKPSRWWTTKLEQDQPRPTAVIARELKKAARKALQKKS